MGFREVVHSDRTEETGVTSIINGTQTADRRSRVLGLWPADTAYGISEHEIEEEIGSAYEAIHAAGVKSK
ncbi:DUF768 domain-containing protein [Mesorhizobium sp. B2-6-2]|nr:DUF768 domain-containing protein [Mesorhizobium sp. B2-6-2]